MSDREPIQPLQPREGHAIYFRPATPGPYYRDGDWWRATAWDAAGNPVTLVPWEDE